MSWIRWQNTSYTSPSSQTLNYLGEVGVFVFLNNNQEVSQYGEQSVEVLESELSGAEQDLSAQEEIQLFSEAGGNTSKVGDSDYEKARKVVDGIVISKPP